MKKSAKLNSSVIGEISSYISYSTKMDLSSEVIEKAKYHIIDTLASIISGSKLKPGRLAKAYARKQKGVMEAQVITSKTITSAINAAFANGIMAHADETDDFHAESVNHPGCAIVPAALAISEKEESDGRCFLNGVVTGYDIGCRITKALGTENLWKRSSSICSIGGVFGAAAASSSIAKLRENQIGWVLSYTAQQASGLSYLLRDEEHIEKAFVFGGMPARDGLIACTLIQSGFTGVSDPFSGENNFLEAFSPKPNPILLIDGLGSKFEIMYAGLKKYPVGAPIQAALQALLFLIEKYGLTPTNVKSIMVRLPENRALIVDNRNMPDINLQHILAVTLLDGNITFDTAHSFKRMKDPQVIKIKQRVTLFGDPEFKDPHGMRPAIVEVTTKDDNILKEHVAIPRGYIENPMTKEEVEQKCMDLIMPVLKKERSKKLIDVLWNIEKIKNMRELRPLLSGF